MQALSRPEYTFGLQQLAQALDRVERLRMTIAEGLAPPLHDLAEQRRRLGGGELGGGEVALCL